MLRAFYRHWLKTGGHVWLFVVSMFSATIVLFCGQSLTTIWHNQFTRDIGFVGAILGAVVGGIMTITAQLATATYAKFQKDAGVGLSLFFKLMQIGSRLEALIREMDCNIKAGSEAGLFEPWRYVLPSANTLAEVHFSADEIVLVLSLKESDLFTLTAALDDLYNSDLGLEKTLTSLALELRKLLTPTHMTGVLGVVEPGPDSLALRATINDLAPKVLTTLRKDCDQAFDACFRLQSRLREQFGVPDPPLKRKV